MPEAHLDDEQLSALVDRDADDEHVRACAACEARLEALRAAAALVGAPVAPLATDLVDRIVARAVDEAEQATRVVAMDRVARRRRWTPSPAILAAAAAVLVLLLAVPALMGGTGGSSTDSQTAAGGAAEEATEAESDSLADNGASASTDQSLTREAAGGSAAIAAPTGDFDTRAASILAFETEADLLDHLIAVLSTTPPAEGTDDTTPEPSSSCEPAARRVGGSRLGGRTYVGAIRWRSVDAEVHVFDLTEPVDGAARQVYVMASQDCRVLVEPRF